MKKILVKKRSGRLEPFDSRKMGRAVSRTGIPYPVALDISRTVKNSNQLADKEQVSSITLRRMVSEELRSRGQDGMAESYSGYRKKKESKGTKVQFERSLRHGSKVKKSIKTHAKQRAKTRGRRSGNTRLSRTSR